MLLASYCTESKKIRDQYMELLGLTRRKHETPDCLAWRSVGRLQRDRRPLALRYSVPEGRETIVYLSIYLFIYLYPPINTT